MRLVCPNCDAEYEVDPSVIPDSGRDVQCSNCGHTWFQLPPDVEAAIDDEEALYEPPPPRAPEVTAPAAEDDAELEAGDAPPPPPEPMHRSIDESVLAVLREEAEREVEARKAEAPPAIETQTEMGLQAAAQAGAGGAIARRIAKLKGEPEPVAPQTRKEMLPEIEELNSTLRSSSEKRGAEVMAGPETMAEAKGRSGFRSGFTLMVVIAAVLVAVYLMAPKLAQQFPAAGRALDSYVVLVDQGRVALDGMVKSAIAFLQGLTGKSG